MPETKPKRLSKVAKELNVATSTIVDTLKKQGISIDDKPNTKINPEAYHVLLERFDSDRAAKEKSQKVKLPNSQKAEEQSKSKSASAQAKEDTAATSEKDTASASTTDPGRQQPRVLGKVDLSQFKDSGRRGHGGRRKGRQERSKSREEKPAEPESAKPAASPEKPSEVEKPAEPSRREESEAPERSAPQASPEKTESAPEVSPSTEASSEQAPEATKPEAETPATEAPAEEAPKETAAPEQAEEQSTASAESPATEAPSSEAASEATVSQSTEAPTQPEADTKSEEAETSEEPQAAPTPTAETASTESETSAPPEAAPSETAAEAPQSEASQAPQGEAPEKPKAEEAQDPSKLKGLKIVGKINLEDTKPKRKPVASSTDTAGAKKKRRRRRVPTGKPEGTEAKSQGSGQPSEARTAAGPKKPEQAGSGAPRKGAQQPAQAKKRSTRKERPEVDEKQVQEQLKATLSRMNKGGKGSKQKIKRKKREQRAMEREAQMAEEEASSNVLEVTEFITANELASIMDVPVTDIITTCMNLGLMVSINQRLDAETIDIVTEEFGYEAQFKDVELNEEFEEEPQDDESELVSRAPVVTIMGHVDHGKTSLLDHIRKSKIIAGEAGGITQHIGAYEVKLENNKELTFLDTPGHEAFTAMRARGAQLTDVVIIVIAADDNVMPQTKEAISHAQAAGVPIVFAYNKVDKDSANVERVRASLAEMNVLVEEYGGKYQTQEISAKYGSGVDELLEKVLLEAEVLELKANPKRRAQGAVVEATLEKGRGIVSTLLVQTGTMRVGDPIIAGASFGRVKAMFNERGQKVKEAGPSQPVQVLGFDEAPNSGEKFYVPEDESRAKEIATERKQLIREQGIRATKHITLDEIGRRIAIGNFKELAVIVKGDVDGSVEALSDSLLKLSTEEIQVKVIHKGVGQITESDVLLASASDAIIVGFQVRPSSNARRIAEQEQIDIRLYSVIYDAIEEIKSAMEGMLSPEIKEEIKGSAEVRMVYKISKVGTIAGCYVTEGKIARNHQARLIRDGVVVYTGELESLKRFKEDTREVSAGYECGMKIKNYNDIREGDVIESFTQVEVSRTL